MKLELLKNFVDEQPAVTIPDGSKDVKVRYFVKYIEIAEIVAAQEKNNIVDKDGSPKRSTQADLDAEYGYKPFSGLMYVVEYTTPALLDDDGKVFREAEPMRIGATPAWEASATEITEAEAIDLLQKAKDHSERIVGAV